MRGTVQVPAADGGARLEVDLLATTASLAKVKSSGSATVGRLIRSSVRAGKLSFSVTLTARGKRALHRHRRLPLTARIVLTPQHGAASTLTREIVVRP